MSEGNTYTGVGTTFFCHDGQGRFLMSKRSSNCRDEQGKWEIAGGSLEWGSTLEENVRREVKEEFAATAKTIELIGHREVFRRLSDGRQTHWVMFDYIVEVDPREVKRNEPHKADALDWFTLDTQPKEVHSQHRTFMSKYSRQINQCINENV